MISRELARELAAYLRWEPQNGDQFFIPRPEIADSVFLMSDMVVELITRNGDTRFDFQRHGRVGARLGGARRRRSAAAGGPAA